MDRTVVQYISDDAIRTCVACGLTETMLSDDAQSPSGDVEAIPIRIMTDGGSGTTS
jgi:hypothetical protein